MNTLYEKTSHYNLQTTPMGPTLNIYHSQVVTSSTIWTQYRTTTASYHRKLKVARDRNIAYTNTQKNVTKIVNPIITFKQHTWNPQWIYMQHITENSNSQGIASSHIWTHYMQKTWQTSHHITENSNSQGIASSHIQTHSYRESHHRTSLHHITEYMNTIIAHPRGYTTRARQAHPRDTYNKDIALN